MTKITSKENKTTKFIKKLLADKKNRDQSQLFVAETHRVIADLLISKLKIKNLIIANDTKYLSFAKEQDKKGIKVTIIPRNVFNTLSSLKNSDGILAIFEKRVHDFSIKNNGKYIVLHQIQNPGNLGSIIRTAAGFNLDGIIISNDSVDIYHPNVLRSTMGAIFATPISFATSLKDVITKFKLKNIRTYATSLSNHAEDIGNIIFNAPCAVIFGNEGNGLTTENMKLCDEQIYIPITNKIQSLNVAAACAIIMYKMVN